MTNTETKLRNAWHRADYDAMADLTGFAWAFCCDFWTDDEARALMVEAADARAELNRRAEALTLRLATERANARTAELLS